MRQETASINLGWLSDYRAEIMGVCAIGIILCHANLAHVAVPSVVKKILGTGNFCVDIFMLLSGIGIWFSLNKSTDIKLGDWYKKRFIRIIIPYLIIYIPYYVWRCAANHYSVLKFLYYISTLGYWFEHDGAWFVALLLPLYLLTPFVYKSLNRLNKKIHYIIDGLLIAALYLICALPFNTGNTTINNLIYNIQFAFCRAPCYIIGFCIVGGVKQRKNISPIYIGVLLIIQWIAYAVLHNTGIYIYGPLAIAMTFVFAWAFAAIRTSWVHKAGGSLGRVSLESYLSNVVLIDVVIKVKLLSEPTGINQGNYLYYLTVVLLTVVSAYTVSEISKQVIQHLKVR